MQNVQARDSFFFFSNPNDILRRENYLNYPVLVFHGEGGLGLPPRGRACWARWHCGRQFGESRCEADILLPCHLVPTRQLSWEAKRKPRQPSLSACWSITSLGHSQHTGRWHRVTSANLWISRIVSFLPLVLPSRCFCHNLWLCSGKGCPTHTFPATQGRCDTGLMVKEVICLHICIFPRGSIHCGFVCHKSRGLEHKEVNVSCFKSWLLLLCTGKQFPPGLVDRD